MLPLAARKLLCYGYRHVCKMLNANKDELELGSQTKTEGITSLTKQSIWDIFCDVVMVNAGMCSLAYISPFCSQERHMVT
jgi:hypothetical protein